MDRATGRGVVAVSGLLGVLLNGPGVARAFDADLAQVVVTADRDADVIIDGKLVGTAPRRLAVPPGQHRIVVHTPDQLWGAARTIIVNKGESKVVALTLRFLGGMLLATSQPPGATVMVGDRVLGTTPLREALLPTGDLDIELRLEGYQSHRTQVEIGPGLRTMVNAVLVPSGSARESKTVAIAAARPLRQRRRSRLWTWVTAGSVGVAVGLGIGFSVSARANNDRVQESLTVALDGNESASIDQIRYLQGVRDRDSTIANVAFGVAGVLAITSVILFFIEGGTFTERAEKPALVFGPGQAGLKGVF
jgi:hypothetical protein